MEVCFNRPNGDCSHYILYPIYSIGWIEYNDHRKKRRKIVKSRFEDFEDLKTMTREERQTIYLQIMEKHLAKGEFISPRGMKKLLEEEYGQTFEFIGQDMTHMRSWEEIIHRKRGLYGIAD